MTTTTPQGQINAPDQLGCMSTLRTDNSKVPMQATPHGTLLEQIMDPCQPKNEREWAASREIERLRTSLEMSQASPLSEEAMDIMKAENDKLTKQIWDSNDVKVAMAIKHTTEVNRLKEEVERLQKLKDYWADIVHSERKEYNALQDSTLHDEALLRECYEKLMDMDRFIDVQDKLRERLGIK